MLRKEEIVDLLIKVARESNGTKHGLAAIQALGYANDGHAQGLLVEIVTDTNGKFGPDVREAAILALGQSVSHS